jgi:glycosyltransferase involved in cell wall biosynthesis
MPDQTTPSPEQPKQPAEAAPRPQQQRAPQQRHQQQGRFSQNQQRGQQQWADISVVVPLYNDEESLRELHQQLRSTLGRMNLRYEIIFIDDGSTDGSIQVLRDLRRNDKHIRIYRFRRNYGKSAALSVGFEKAQGNVIITMDADLQDDPAEIPALKRKLEEGYDLVSGWKRVRHDPITKTIPSRFFNFVTSLMTGVRLHDINCGLKAYRKDVVKSVNVYGELHRYVPVLAHWEGFKVGEIVVHHRARKFGKTKFGLGRFWKGFLDLLTVLFTTRYFRRPLHFFGPLGLIAILAGVVIDGILVAEWFQGTTALTNRPLFLVGIMLIIVGIQFFSIGLLGEMITKSRRMEEEYLIKEVIK